MRFNAGLTRDLWEDEVTSAVHSEQPFWRLPVEVMRLDIHPFLYYLQLHAWALVGHGDVWLRLNSVAWNLFAIASIYLVARRLYGLTTAWIAAPLFALAAPVVWMAQELRAYSWIYCLVIWAFYFVERSFGPGARGWANRVAAWALCTAIVYSHALGFFPVLLLGLYALCRIFEAGLTGRAAALWAVLFGLCALAALPPLMVDLLRDANLTSRGGLAELLDWIPRLVLPRGDAPVLLALAAAVYLSAAVFGLAVRETRLMTVVFLVTPICVAQLLGTVNVHMFKPNIFCTMITPFLVLVLSRLAARWPHPQRWIVGGALAVLFTLFSTAFFIDRTPTTGFRVAGQLIEHQAQPGDIVYVPQQSMFWGMARYMGAGRGWQLDVAPALTPQWRHLFDRLGPWIVTTFNLEPRTQLLTMPSGPPLLVGTSSAETAARARRVWLVTYARADLPPGYPPDRLGQLARVSTNSVGFLRIGLYQ